MSTVFAASYQCFLDPELSGAGTTQEVHSFGARLQTRHLVRISHPNCADWYAELSEGDLVANGVTGAYATPSPDHVLVVVNGSGYYVDARHPGQVREVDIDPITQIHAVPDQRLLVLISPWEVTAYAAIGHLWTSSRIAVDGVRFLGTDGRCLVLDADHGDEHPRRVRLAMSTGMIER